MIGIIFVAALAAYSALTIFPVSMPASGREKPHAHSEKQGTSCADIRAVVAIIGADQAEAAARAAGASNELIAKAKKCLSHPSR